MWRHPTSHSRFLLLLLPFNSTISSLQKVLPYYFTDLHTSCESRRAGTISFTKVLSLGHPISQWLGKDRTSCPTLGPILALHCVGILWELILSSRAGSEKRIMAYMSQPPIAPLSKTEGMVED